jgi:hypothetical protein
MKTVITIIFSLLIFVSCKQKEKSGIEFSDKYLSSHEWVIDSIYGSDEFIRDWIYFTPEQKFYRFSKNNKSYVIDSALIWKHNKVFKNNSQLFTIRGIDSLNIELKTSDKIYFAKRWNTFHREQIERFIKNNNFKLKINGKWKLDSLEIKKARMPSYCNEITSGAIFDFEDNGRLKVYQKDSINYCNKYSYRIREKEISLLEYDMILNFPIIEFDKNKLILESRYIQKNAMNEKSWKAKRKGFNLYFSRIER